MFEKLVSFLFVTHETEDAAIQPLYDIELTCVPEEIYYQITEVEQTLPFDV